MKIRASVAMAVYNGEKYIREQINSILELMSPDDELVISYNKSIDATLEIIKYYETNDSRVKICFDEGCSVESNFNNAVTNCLGKYIFLADQDDVWINDKINVMCEYFEDHPDVKILISDGYLTDEKLNCSETMYEALYPKRSGLINFIKGTYLGCQMAFDASIRDLVWPVSVNPPLPHDLWLGVLGGHYGKIGIISDKLLLHRLHGKNYSDTSKMKLLEMIKERLFFFKELILRIMKNQKNNRRVDFANKL